MRVLIIVFLFIGVTMFAQSDQKGTITVKKLSPVVKKDTTLIFDTVGYGFSFFNWSPPIYSSYGQTYDRPPEYTGGIGAEKQFIETTRKYPDCYRCKGTTVGSDLTVMVNENGSLTEITLKKGATDCPKCDEEALRIIKLMPNWQVAQSKGQNIKLKWDIYISFTYLK